MLGFWGVATLLDIIRAAASPEGRRILGFMADQLNAGETNYEKLHWGRSGRPAIVEDLPTEGPLTHLGALSHIGYVTEKGGDRGPANYLHTFATPLPGLFVDATGQLRILRGRSKYRTSSHGIEG